MYDLCSFTVLYGVGYTSELRVHILMCTSWQIAYPLSLCKMLSFAQSQFQSSLSCRHLFLTNAIIRPNRACGYILLLYRIYTLQIQADVASREPRGVRTGELSEGQHATHMSPRVPGEAEMYTRTAPVYLSFSLLVQSQTWAANTGWGLPHSFRLTRSHSRARRAARARRPGSAAPG